MGAISLVILSGLMAVLVVVATGPSESMMKTDKDFAMCIEELKIDFNEEPKDEEKMADNYMRLTYCVAIKKEEIKPDHTLDIDKIMENLPKEIPSENKQHIKECLEKVEKVENYEETKPIVHCFTDL